MFASYWQKISRGSEYQKVSYPRLVFIMRYWLSARLAKEAGRSYGRNVFDELPARLTQTAI